MDFGTLYEHNLIYIVHTLHTVHTYVYLSTFITFIPKNYFNIRCTFNVRYCKAFTQAAFIWVTFSRLIIHHKLNKGLGYFSQHCASQTCTFYTSLSQGKFMNSLPVSSCSCMLVLLMCKCDIYVQFSGITF